MMDPIFDQRRYLIPFRSSLLPQIFTDTLVIGGGVAGLRAAIAAAGADDAPGSPASDVIVLSKSAFSQTNTAWAQGGVAAVLRVDDTFDAHVEDTLVAGAGLSDEPTVRRVVSEGAARMQELIAWGARFDRAADGALLVGREGGHSASRIYHTDGDATGAEFQRLLLDRARRTPGVRVFEGCFALDLITPSNEPGSTVLGAVTHHPKYGLQMIWARTTILASGGAGQVYRETSNPRAATADGVAMAYRAGATVQDMAFVQFHPTVLYLPGAPRTLISEAVRGEGAVLVDASGRGFMTGVHELADLAPRDIVSRAIVRQIAKHGGAGGSGTHVWLDARPVHDFAARFPSIHASLRKFDIDPARDPIPVHPAAHYMVGGVRADADGRTDVPGLLAVGEAASTGLHGANRLASNSLLEGLVDGARAGALARAAAVASGPGAVWKPVPVVSDIRPSDHGELDLTDVRSSLRSAMWRNVGIERTGPKLADAAEMCNLWARYTLDKIFDDPTGWETQNLLLAAALVTRSASWRQESRGCHWRADFPEVSPGLALHDAWRRLAAGPVTIPVAGGQAAPAHSSPAHAAPAPVGGPAA